MSYSRDLPSSPDFSFMDQTSNHMLSSAYQVIHKCEAWHILANFKGESFVFTKDKQIQNIMQQVSHAYPGHSGSSMGITMRQIEFIAKNGFTIFKNEYIT
jgi:hypothetical protein